jgi:hypothetical protein
VTTFGRKRQAAGTSVVNAVLQDVADKLAAVDSPIGVEGDTEKQLIAMTPLGRIGRPQMSHRSQCSWPPTEASWLKGEIISASGGLC